MQFKNPEILYFLFFLIVPILVHLFQLRRFKKQEFTNVKLLKELEIQTRKSSTIKKWLLLITRLLILACIIIAFAQPYFKAKKSDEQNNELIVVLDNSFSMQAKGNKGELLKSTIQEILESTPENQKLSFITITDNFYDTDVKTIQSELQNITYTSQSFNPDIILNRIQSKKPSINKDILFITDALGLKGQLNNKYPENNIYFYPIQSENQSNVSIKNVSISNSSFDFYEIKAELNYFGEINRSTPISLWNDNQLLAKSTISKDNLLKEIKFSIPKKNFKGYFQIEDGSLKYDNQFYFNITTPQKATVMLISEGDFNFLEKIYTPDDFIISKYNSQTIDYNQIEKQDVIVLNEIKTISNALITTLKNFYAKGGSVVFIPSNNGQINQYNNLLQSFGKIQFNKLNIEDKQITKINFSHTLYSNVFEKKVTNFQYPTTHSNFSNSGNYTSILSYTDQQPFLAHVTNKIGNFYWFTSALNKENTNFQNAPLIVPTFYNFGINYNTNVLNFFTIGENQSSIIDNTTSQNQVLKLKKGDLESIPTQQIFGTKIKLYFNEFPQQEGNYQLVKNQTIIKNLSFNYQRNESNLMQKNESYFEKATSISSINTFYNDIHTQRSNNEFWKIFIILTLLFILTEIAIQKLIK